MSIPLLESREPQLLVPEARVVSSAAPHSGAAVLQGRVGALEPLPPRRRGLASSTGLPPPCAPPGLRLFAAGTILLARVRRLSNAFPRANRWLLLKVSCP